VKEIRQKIGLYQKITSGKSKICIFLKVIKVKVPLF